MKRESVITIVIVSISLCSCGIFGSDGDGDLPGEPGEIVWSVDHKKSQSVSTQPLIDEDRVFVLHDGFLRAYELKTGELIWSQTLFTNGKVRIFMLNLLKDDEFVYIDWGFSFAAFSKENGNRRWITNYTTDGRDFSGTGGARMSMDESYLYLPRNKKVLKADKTNGDIVLEFSLLSHVPEGIVQGATETLVSPFGDEFVYVATGMWDTTGEQDLLRGNLFAFNKHSGEILWVYTPPNRVKTTPGFEADTILVASHLLEIDVLGDFIYASGGPLYMKINRHTGQVNWIWPNRSIRFAGAPGAENTVDSSNEGMTVDETGIYMATVDGFAIKFDLDDGSEIWRTDTKFTQEGIITLLNDKLYFTNNGGGEIWVLDKMNGNIVFNALPPGFENNRNDVYLSSLGVGNGFMVNTGAMRVYALRSFE